MSKQLKSIEKYLAGQMAIEEIGAFEQDLLRDPALKKALDQLKVIDDALEIEVEDKLRDQLKELAQSKKKAATPKIKISLRQVLIVAATLLILVVIGIWWSINTNSTDLKKFASDQYIIFTQTNLRAEESNSKFAPAFSLLALKDTVQAIQWLEQWLVANPEDMEATFLLADLSYQSGAWQQAEKIFLNIAQTRSILWGEKSAWNYVLISAQRDWTSDAENMLKSIIADKNHSFYRQATELEKIR